MKSWEDNFREYLRKYCKSRNILPEVAIEHKIVQDMREYYQKLGDTDLSEIPTSTWTESGCCK